MSNDDDQISRLTQNDSSVTVVNASLENCSQLAAALSGNNHVEMIAVCVGDTSHHVTKVSAQWTEFCLAVHALKSLQQLSITFRREIPSQGDSFLASLLLRHTAHIKKLTLNCVQGGQGELSAIVGAIARDIMHHPSLESLTLEHYRCSGADEEPVALLVLALETLPNLKSLDLSSQFEGEDPEFVTHPLFNAEHLGRILQIKSLEQVALRFYELGKSHIKTLGASKLKELELELCYSSIKGTFFGQYLLSTNTSLEHLGMAFVSFPTSTSDDRESCRNMLGALSSNRSLKSLKLFNLDLPVDQDCWPRFDFLQQNATLETLDYGEEDKPIALEALTSLFRGLVNNISLHTLDICCNGAPIDSQLLSPLSSSKGLKNLTFQMMGRNAEDGFPRFDFLQENNALEYLQIIIPPCFSHGCFLSLCQSLHTNSSLKELLVRGSFKLGELVGPLVQAIGQNSGLKELNIDLPREGLSDRGYFDLLPAFQQNTSIEKLNLGTSSLSANMTYQKTAEFVKSLVSDSRLREITVGPCDSKHAESIIVPAMAHNYHIEELFLLTDSNCPVFGTDVIITELNKAGRGYLGDSERGPWCKAAGVNVLSEVSDYVDFLYYHLRENPLLCDGRFGPDDETANHLTQPRAAKKRRTCEE